MLTTVIQFATYNDIEISRHHLHLFNDCDKSDTSILVPLELKQILSVEQRCLIETFFVLLKV